MDPHTQRVWKALTLAADMAGAVARREQSDAWIGVASVLQYAANAITRGFSADELVNLLRSALPPELADTDPGIPSLRPRP